MKYKMMTAKEIVDLLYEMPDDEQMLYFTYDDCTDFEEGDEPDGGVYCVKFTRIFDEFDKVFAIGYMGGGSTVAYDLYGCVDNTYDSTYLKEFCTKKLQEFLDTWCEWGQPGTVCEKVCVEIIKED